jgi:hypothetical protein
MLHDLWVDFFSSKFNTAIKANTNLTGFGTIIDVLGRPSDVTDHVAQ